MNTLEIVGLSATSQTLILRAGDGQEFELAVDDKLRAAIRSDRTALEKLRAEGKPSPREIQAMIRAGASAADVAEANGLDLAYVERFETAVLAERAHIADLAAAARIGKDSDSPTLGDLVADRLAASGVDAVDWDAAKSGEGRWTVTAIYTLAGKQTAAQWAFEPASKQLAAVDSQARGLTESASPDAPIPPRHLSAVRADVFDVVADDSARDLQDRRERLLEDLNAKRGVRQELADPDEDDEEFEGFGPAQAIREEGARRAESAATPAEPATGELDLGLDQPAAQVRPLKRARTSVPSWDEIVFGGKSDA